jgi:biopolymer transport protein ExbB
MNGTEGAPGAETLDGQLLDLMLRVGSRWVLWLLLGLSLVAVAVILERTWFLLIVRRHRAAVERALAQAKAQGPKAALEALGAANSLEAHVARAAFEAAPMGPEAVEEEIRAAVETGRLRYERNLAYLGTLGSNAPFVGLFGTVLGIIRAFHDLAMNTTAGAAAVMAGIAEALVATGVGLLVALPAVAAYNTFARFVEASVASAEAVGHRVLAHVKARPPADASRGEVR